MPYKDILKRKAYLKAWRTKYKKEYNQWAKIYQRKYDKTPQRKAYFKKYCETHKEELKEYNKQYRKTEKYRAYQKDYQRNYRKKEDIKIKNKARSLAKYWLREILDRQCEICHILQAQERHHHDYNKPLDVIYVCRGCHQKLHHGY